MVVLGFGMFFGDFEWFWSGGFWGILFFLLVIIGGIVEFWKVLGCSAWFLMIWEVGEWFWKVLGGFAWFWEGLGAKIDPKGCPIGPQSNPKGPPKGPNGPRRVPKGAKIGPKGNPKEPTATPKRSQNGALKPCRFLFNFLMKKLPK